MLLIFFIKFTDIYLDLSPYSCFFHCFIWPTLVWQLIAVALVSFDFWLVWWPYTCTILISLNILYFGEQLFDSKSDLSFLVHRTPLMDNFGLGNLAARMRLSWNYTSLKFHSVFSSLLGCFTRSLLVKSVVRWARCARDWVNYFPNHILLSDFWHHSLNHLLSVLILRKADAKKGVTYAR